MRPEPGLTSCGVPIMTIGPTASRQEKAFAGSALSDDNALHVFAPNEPAVA